MTMKKQFALVLAALMALAMLLCGTAMAEAEATATELYYTPGEDLLLGEAEGVKLWLDGRVPADFCQYYEPWHCYNWYNIRVENESDHSVYLGYDLTLPKLQISGGFNETKPHTTENKQLNFGASDTVNEDFVAGISEAVITLRLCEDMDLNNVIAELETVTVHFGASEEAVVEGNETAADATAGTGAEAPDSALNDFLGTWEFSRVAVFDDDGNWIGSLSADEAGDMSMIFEIAPESVRVRANEEEVVLNTLEIQTDEKSGKHYLHASDDGGDYFALYLTEMGGETYLYFITPAYTLYFARTGDAQATVADDTADDVEAAEVPDDGAGEAAETDGPGEVHTDKETVKAAQQALNDAGYSCGTPDGIAGKKTAAAITAYQEANGLNITGTVTDELLAAMGITQETGMVNASSFMIPQELIDFTGGVPDNLDALPDRGILETLKAFSIQLDFTDMIRGLWKDGSYTFPSLDCDLISGTFEIGDKAEDMFDLVIEKADGSTTLSLGDDYLPDPLTNTFHLYLDFSNGCRLACLSDYDGASDTFTYSYKGASTHIRKKEDTKHYSNVDYSISYRSAQEKYEIWLSAYPKSGEQIVWQGFYDDTGKLIDMYYYYQGQSYRLADFIQLDADPGETLAED